MAVMIGPTTNNNQDIDLSIRKRISIPAMQKISNELNAGGRVAVAEHAFQTVLGMSRNYYPKRIFKLQQFLIVKMATKLESSMGIQASLSLNYHQMRQLR